MAHLLGAESVSVCYPTATVLQGVTLGVDEGMRIGIVGRNGDGKSTLLRVLARQQEPDDGRVTHRGGLRVGVLGQTDDLAEDATITEAVLGDLADHEWASDRRSREAVEALVGDLDMSTTIGNLSGGQRRRAALAALLLGSWDVLVLDEPTNHLDVDAITWLARHLRDRWPKGQGALLLVTHDRWFLDEVATTTWEVHDGVVDPFEGGYAAYVLQRVERDRQNAVLEAKRQNMMRKELAWLRRGAPARTSKPRFRIEAANQLIEDVPPLRDRVELSRMATARLGKDVVDLHEAGVTYKGAPAPVLRDIEWRIAPGERTGIVGGNGSGKSTLLALIAGSLAPTAGRVKRGKTVRIGILDQQFDQLAQISGDRVRDVLARYQTTYSIDGSDLTPAQLLERLGFRTPLLSARVGDLSGGQRRRLQLLLVLLDEPNVLLLDEPTNDVDTDTLAAMEDLLDTWPGTLLVISHDRYLLERVTDNQYAILDGRLRHLPGGVDEYLQLRAAMSAQAAPEPATAGSDTGATGAQRHAAQKEIASLERRIERLQAQIEAERAALAEHDHSDYVGLGAAAGRIEGLQSELSELEHRWYEAMEVAG
ncbi:ABC-F family ATP-binding cassette domain-containing protein [Pseudactinotalea suaedae]|uniref:ABC-F family ATP-binding cassette domain-containing protein n=1 Tax=Pseudactinotalea suaedae TaxID=1524924 RepID=UPI0012E1FDFA|nr:ABC-F family ATP-binding cassette domain-containing protein [Pseudactinotalea suaedae]